MKFIIAGAGIGGLTVSIALARQGHAVQILEQAPEPKPIGAGISLQPNALHSLATLELDSEISSRGYTSQVAEIRLADGTLVRRMDFRPLLETYGCFPVMIHRGDLFDVLHGRATKLGVETQFGHPVDSYVETGNGVRVSAAATEFVGDALIGADGINSRVRDQLVGETPKIYSGYVCWRGIVSDPQVVEPIDTMSEVWGSGARFGFMRCRHDLVYWFATKTTADRNGDDHWKQTFQSWMDPIEKLINATRDEQIVFNDICDRDPIFPWSRGCVTLLGDAAHPMTPNFGQGGAQAIEDAVVLGRAIERYARPSKAFAVYQQKRARRTASIVKSSRQFGRIAQGGNRWWRFLRRRVLPLIPQSATERMLHQQLSVHHHLELGDAPSDVEFS